MKSGVINNNSIDYSSYGIRQEDISGAVVDVRNEGAREVRDPALEKESSSKSASTIYDAALKGLDLTKGFLEDDINIKSKEEKKAIDDSFKELKNNLNTLRKSSEKIESSYHPLSSRAVVSSDKMASDLFVAIMECMQTMIKCKNEEQNVIVAVQQSETEKRKENLILQKDTKLKQLEKQFQALFTEAGFSAGKLSVGCTSAFLGMGSKSRQNSLDSKIKNASENSYLKASESWENIFKEIKTGKEDKIGSFFKEDLGRRKINELGGMSNISSQGPVLKNKLPLAWQKLDSQKLSEKLKNSKNINLSEREKDIVRAYTISEEIKKKGTVDIEKSLAYELGNKEFADLEARLGPMDKILEKAKELKSDGKLREKLGDDKHDIISISEHYKDCETKLTQMHPEFKLSEHERTLEKIKNHHAKDHAVFQEIAGGEGNQISHEHVQRVNKLAEGVKNNIKSWSTEYGMIQASDILVNTGNQTIEAAGKTTVGYMNKSAEREYECDKLGVDQEKLDIERDFTKPQDQLNNLIHASRKNIDNLMSIAAKVY